MQQPQGVGGAPPIDYSDQYQPIMGGSMGGHDMGSLELKLRTEDILLELENILLNRVIEVDPKTGETKIFQKGKPLLSEHGVSEVMTTIRPFFNRGIILSNFRDDEIERIMRLLHVKVALTLASKVETLGVSNYTNLHMIVEIITNMIWASFKRAQFALEQNFMSKTQHVTESRVIAEQPKKKFLGIFGGG